MRVQAKDFMTKAEQFDEAIAIIVDRMHGCLDDDYPDRLDDISNDLHHEGFEETVVDRALAEWESHV